MKKKNWAAAAAGSALMIAAGAAAGAEAQRSPFDSVVVFGDSLSDNGDISIVSGIPQIMKFTTNPGDVTAELVASHYGFDLAPSLAGGTDFAFGGAGVLQNSPGTPAAVPTLSAQINGYLAAHPSLDANALYSYWGGANDIFYAASQVAGGAATPTQAISTVTATGATSGALIGRLQAAGAKTVLVFNLPDIGRTPAAQASEAAAPGSALLLTGMTLGYNGALNQSLAGRHGVVPINVYAYFNEVLANPSLFGFSNVTTPACTVASSLLCSPATLRDPDAATTYLFADGVHPTTASHQGLADLVISELAAPGQMSLLAEAPLALTSAGSLAVQGELARQVDAPAPGVHVFASGGYVNSQTATQLTEVARTEGDAYSGTAGVSVGMDGGLTGGVALTVGRDRVDWAGRAGHFDLDGVTVAAFGQYALGSSGYINLIGQGTQASFDVTREFQLGATRRTETADPDGWSAGVRVGAGYWFGMGGAQTGPFVSGEYQHVHVDSFSEHGSDSTAMTFDDQTREALIGKVGWAVKTTVQAGAATVRPFASVAYAHDDKADRRSLTAGLVSLNGDFETPGYRPERNWVEAGAGLSAEFNDRWGAQIAYAGHFANDDRRVQTVSVGLHAAF